MITNHKIAIINLFYGEWPDWFPYYLQTCSANSAIEWLIITDQPAPADYPGNVRFHSLTPDQLEKRILRILNIQPAIHHPYKLTDFKPAYGLIFREFLAGYTHWGYADLDLIYGSVENFIDDAMLEEFDIISPSRDFFPGHFMLFRNTDLTLNLFKDAKNWKDIFRSDKYHCFDEHLLRKGIFPDPENIYRQVLGKIKRHVLEYRLTRNPVTRCIKKLFPSSQIISNQRKATDFNRILMNKSRSGMIKTKQQLLFSDDIIHMINGQRDIHITWKNGRLYDNDREIMYYHFQLAKYDNTFGFAASGKDSFILSASLTV